MICFLWDKTQLPSPNHTWVRSILKKSLLLLGRVQLINKRIKLIVWLQVSRVTKIIIVRINLAAKIKMQTVMKIHSSTPSTDRNKKPRQRKMNLALEKKEQVYKILLSAMKVKSTVATLMIICPSRLNRGPSTIRIWKK